MPSELRQCLTILQVCTSDSGGGAEYTARRLFEAYRQRGHISYLAVGRKTSEDKDIRLIPPVGNGDHWGRVVESLRRRLQPMVGKVHGAGRVMGLLRWVGSPRAFRDFLKGYEDLHYPGSWDLLRLIPKRPDVVHCHNLHGGFFDLRFLKKLSQEVPLILNLRDAWLLTGHCAHFFDCMKWKTGCGDCPDLRIYPAIFRDATRFNWKVKKGIYETSRLYLTTPSQWLMGFVKDSMLKGVDYRVIPNGVDLHVFKPADREGIRALLNFPPDIILVLFVAYGTRSNVWKDYPTLEEAIHLGAKRARDREILFVCLGEEGRDQKVENARIRFIGYERDPRRVAMFYQAADLYIHAAKVDVFPRTILEALACGIPVVATAVGGIPEMVRGLGGPLPFLPDLNDHGPEEATGILTPKGDPEAMALAMDYLLSDGALRRRLSRNAAADAAVRFSLDRQVDAFLGWYCEIIADWKSFAHSKGELEH